MIKNTTLLLLLVLPLFSANAKYLGDIKYKLIQLEHQTTKNLEKINNIENENKKIEKRITFLKKEFKENKELYISKSLFEIIGNKTIFRIKLKGFYEVLFNNLEYKKEKLILNVKVKDADGKIKKIERSFDFKERVGFEYSAKTKISGDYFEIIIVENEKKITSETTEEEIIELMNKKYEGVARPIGEDYEGQVITN